eukprot:1158444-Pelagomonas_calceolata.AAC.8
MQPDRVYAHRSNGWHSSAPAKRGGREPAGRDFYLALQINECADTEQLSLQWPSGCANMSCLQQIQEQRHVKHAACSVHAKATE